ncbi:O-antigen ligase family protein [Candidatus Saccharibacteria bacterium]|nr:MAG: O-antigen ligase family protein [Candidatus Saccharibacteria bacterium]
MDRAKGKEQGVKGAVRAISANHRLTTRLPNYVVASVLTFVPVHAFVTVWASTAVGHYTLLRLWPELAVLCLSVWFLASGRIRQTWREFSQFHLGWLILLYLLLSILYFGIAQVRGDIGLRTASYGLLLSTRPIVWFVLVYAIARKSSWLRTHWKRIVLIPFAAVCAFALLQFFILPPDFLKQFGYEKGVTIAPLQTINQDTETIRAQSTLRGPNPLGAYVLLGIGLMWVFVRRGIGKYVLLAASGVALYLSFSRSAWLGLAVAGLAWIAVTKSFLRNARIGASSAVVALLLVLGGVLLALNNQGFKNAIFHANDQSTAAQTSNEDRLSALRDGVQDVVTEPLGRGLGTAGPASMLEDATPARNSENYFLSVGQETGWLGLGLFIAICYRLARALYKRREPFANVLLATFVGLTFVNLLSYAWADVTLAYIWWGLAGIAMATTPHKERL